MLMKTRTHRPSGIGRRSVVFSLIATPVLLMGARPSAVEARGPGLVVTLRPTAMYAEPSVTSVEQALLDAGEEGFLTGAAELVFVQVEFRGMTGWVLASDVTTNGVTGIRLATAVEAAPILDAPTPDAGPLGLIPAGGVAMLTGAEVGGYVAASFNGVGGWVDESLLGLAYDADGTQR